MEYTIELEQKVYDNEQSEELKSFDKLVKFVDSLRGLRPPFETDRLVFGKFEKDGHTLKILKPTWLSEESLNSSKEYKKRNSLNRSDSDKKLNVTFDFTKDLKDVMEKSIDLLYIDDYDAENQKIFLVAEDSPKDFPIPPDWISQRTKTFQTTGYKIRSKVVFPIMGKKKKEENFLWGVAFLESRDESLRKKFSIHDIKFFHMLIKRYGSLLIELDKKHYNQAIDNKFAFITVATGLVVAILGWSFSVPAGYIVGACLISLATVHHFSLKRLIRKKETIDKKRTL